MKRTGSPGGIYIIAASDDGPCKIGRARSALSRLITLQVGNPLKLNLYSVWTSDHLSSAIAERLIHRRLSAHSIRGEWYAVTVADAEALISNLDDKALNNYNNLDTASRLRAAMQSHPLAHIKLPRFLARAND